MHSLLVSAMAALSFAGTAIAAATAVTITASPSPVTFGHPVRISAFITSPSALPVAITGKVTFYDGVAVLGASSVSNGQAALTTLLLPSGTRSLRAYYMGDGVYDPASSAPLSLTVAAVPQAGFQSGTPQVFLAVPRASVIGDFNGDGRLDLAFANSANASTGLTVMLAKDDTSFQPLVYYSTGARPFSIAMGDFNNDGIPDLALPNFDSNTVAIFLGQGDGTFRPATMFPVGTNSYSIVVGDFNNDGKSDLAIGGVNGISILMGNGDGTFKAATVYSVEGTAGSLIAADFNGDGITDLAAVNGGSGVGVLLGNGDGSFHSAGIFPAGNLPYAITAADFNGDGHIDLAVANYYGGDISLLTGNGDGTFQTTGSYQVSSNPVWITTADFNGDGRPDLVVAYSSLSSTAGILLGNGAGFNPQMTYPIADNVLSLAVADLNGDGRADLVTMGSGTLSILRGQPGVSSAVTLNSSLNPSTYTQRITWTASVTPSSASGYVSLYDGASFVATAPLIGGQATFSRNNLNAGTHSLTVGYAGDATYTYSVSSPLLQVVAQADLNVTLASTPNPSRSGQPVSLSATLSNSLATGSVTFRDGLQVLGNGNVNTGVATFKTSTLSAGDHSLNAVYNGDLNFRVHVSGAITQTVLAGVSCNLTASPNPGVYGQPVTLTVASSPTVAGAMVTFFDGVSILERKALVSGQATFRTSLLPSGTRSLRASCGGNADYVAADSPVVSEKVTSAPANGFRAPVSIPTNFASAGPISVADLNGDGRADLILQVSSNGRSTTLAVMLAKSDGTFDRGTALYTLNGVVGGVFLSAAAVDLNGDGKTDIVATDDEENCVLVFLGNGDGSFQAASKYPTGPRPFSLAVADFNGDGIPDLAVDSVLLIGNGDGSFQAPYTIYSFSGTGSIAAADLDGDGKTDLVAASNSGTAVMLGNGDGSFKAPQFYSFPSRQVAVADFNGDGIPDIMSASSFYYNAVQVFLGNGDGTFSGGSPLAVSGPGPFAVEDFNGDGKRDAIIWGQVSNTPIVVMLTGNGDGTFQQLQSTPFHYAYPVVADFNGDGRVDIASGSSTDGMIDIQYGAVANQLTFASQPVSTPLGNAEPSIAVQVLDAASNLVVPYGSPVVTLTSTPAAVSTSAVESLGAAAFNGVAFNSAGTYRLTASMPGLASATSSAFTISASYNNTVSGRVTLGGTGLSGVTVTATGAQPVSTLTDAAGNYILLLLKGTSYTISAARVGFSFSAPVTISNLTSDQSVNFTTSLQAGLQFYPLTPCRMVDTRIASFPAGFGTPSLAGGVTRNFAIASNAGCGIPANAAAYSFNVTAVTRGYLGYLSIWASGQPVPMVSTLNSYSTTPTAISNAAIVPSGTAGGIAVYATDATDLILDINGYFAPPGAGGLDFYATTPCRIVDTRISSFPTGFGVPSMTASETRSFAPPANPNCGIPATAAAYSLNITVVPKNTLGILTIWPAGQTRPNASTLNVYTAGTVVANAAIVPAGAGGAISAWVTDSTDLIIDSNGYFGTSDGNGQKFYPVTPCRVADTRSGAGFPGPFGAPAFAAGSMRSFPVASSACGIPPAAAYSFNFTALPQATRLGIFITWPYGGLQPNVSTMNSYNGSVVSNAAILPAGANGGINIYVTDAANVLFDINGYFAP